MVQRNNRQRTALADASSDSEPVPGRRSIKFYLSSTETQFYITLLYFRTQPR